MSSSTNKSGGLLTWLLNFCKLLQSTSPSCPFLDVGNFSPVASSVAAFLPQYTVSFFTPMTPLPFSAPWPAEEVTALTWGMHLQIWLPSRTITTHKWIREFLSSEWRCQFSESTCSKSQISSTPIFPATCKSLLPSSLCEIASKRGWGQEHYTKSRVSDKKDSCLH